ncbi:dihydrolipoyl dehydrogenase [Cytobacillus sp. Hz8]|uniref:dihydrolipoyl dehydrogenase n=1 Tax=Cytobacillus sp. Hz8 TaxID=3347168 RepID=UPI0035D911C4
MSSIAIIGGGPAGYVAAITAAQQGENVTLIDKGSLGGTCLNEGCMPTKTLLESARVYQECQHLEKFGIHLPDGSIEINWKSILNRKSKIISSLVQGIQYLMKKNKINVIKGEARFKRSHELEIYSEGKLTEFQANQYIIATGSEPIQLPFAPFDSEWIIDSSQAMSLDSIPSSLLVIGGGVIGCEFASIFSRIGTKVTIVEMAEQILLGEDRDIATILHQQLEHDGVNIYPSTALKNLDKAKRKATLENKQGPFELQADVVLVSIGRKPRLEHLGLKDIGVDFSTSGIFVNNQMRTNVENVYACGDVIGGIQLAHVAFHEGTIAALNACGLDEQVNYRAVPRCIYTLPEVASVGLTEKEARETYGDIRIGEFPFSANGKAMIADAPFGKVKVLIEPKYGEIIGISIIGHHATELIAQGTVMLHAELTIDLLENMITAHPTLSEAIQEALLSAIGNAVHA